MRAYVEREKRVCETSIDFDEAARALRKVYDWNIRIEMLEWVMGGGGE
jgi:hypothetical protein